MSTYSKVVSILLVVLVVLILLVVYAVVTEDATTFFPLNNPKGTYKITRGCTEGQGWVEKTQSNGNLYCVEYKGTGVFMDSEVEKHNFFSVTVGKSNVALAPYIGKYVILKGGKFTSSTKQCIKDTCADFGGPCTVLDVYGIEIVR